MISIAVVEQSQISEARRAVETLARQNGFNEEDAGRTALVVTELATNLIKHGGGGEILVGAYDDKDGAGIEILALDKGQGMNDVQACMRDGYSSAGTRGHGLGAEIGRAHV